MSEYQKNQAIADPDIGDSGVVHSDATPLKGGSRKASAAELAVALEASQREIEALKAERAAREAQGSDLKQLASLIADLAAPKTTGVVPEQDAINRSTDFKNQRATVDGRSLVEAQQTMALFRNEEKMPLSIPKTMSNIVGPNLDITVNGVRVSIPCDGKTYYINQTHYEHARERLAKLDRLAANTEPQVVEIS